MNKFALYLNAAVLAAFTTTASATLPWVDNFTNLDNWPFESTTRTESTEVKVENNTLYMSLVADPLETGNARLGIQTNQNPDFNFFAQPLVLRLDNISMSADSSNTDDFTFGFVQGEDFVAIPSGGGSLSVTYRRGSSADSLRLEYREDGAAVQRQDFTVTVPRDLGRAEMSAHVNGTSGTMAFTWFDTDMEPLGSESFSFTADESKWSEYTLALQSFQSNNSRTAEVEIGSVTVIPEPAHGIIMIGLAAALLCVFRRRWRS